MKLAERMTAAEKLGKPAAPVQTGAGAANLVVTPPAAPSTAPAAPGVQNAPKSSTEIIQEIEARVNEAAKRAAAPGKPAPTKPGQKGLDTGNAPPASPPAAPTATDQGKDKTKTEPGAGVNAGKPPSDTGAATGILGKPDAGKGAPLGSPSATKPGTETKKPLPPPPNTPGVETNKPPLPPPPPPPHSSWWSMRGAIAGLGTLLVVVAGALGIKTLRGRRKAATEVKSPGEPAVAAGKATLTTKDGNDEEVTFKVGDRFYQVDEKTGAINGPYTIKDISSGGVLTDEKGVLYAPGMELLFNNEASAKKKSDEIIASVKPGAQPKRLDLNPAPPPTPPTSGATPPAPSWWSRLRPSALGTAFKTWRGKGKTTTGAGAPGGPAVTKDITTWPAKDGNGDEVIFEKGHVFFEVDATTGDIYGPHEILKITAAGVLVNRNGEERSPATHLLFDNAVSAQRKSRKIIASKRPSPDKTNEISSLLEDIRKNTDNAAFRNNLGNAYYRLGKFKEAAQSYQEAIRLQSDNPVYQDNLGNTCLMLGRYEEAVQAFKKAVELRPDNVFFQNNLGIAYYELGLLAEAVQAFGEAVRLDPSLLSGLPKDVQAALSGKPAGGATNPTPPPTPPSSGAKPPAPSWRSRLRPSALLAAAKSWRDRGKAATGAGAPAAKTPPKEETGEIKVILEDINSNPNDATLYRRLSIAYYDLGRFEEALEAIQKAVSLQSGNVLNQSRLGWVYYKLGRLEDAVQAFREAVALDPSVLSILPGDVQTALSGKPAGDAKNPLPPPPAGKTTLQAKDGNGEDVTFEVGKRFYQVNAKTGSISDRPPIDEINAGILVAFGESYSPEAHLLFDNEVSAKRKSEEIKAKAPAAKEEAAHHYATGNYFYSKGEYEKALQPYQEAIRLEPSNATYQNKLGNTFFALGRFPEAVRCYQEAVRLEPNEVIYQHNLGSAYNKQGNYADAVPPYEATVRLEPNNATYQNGLGHTYYTLRRYADAVPPYEAAVRLEPN
ncbi:MAG: tetratricopeptide repeat protein, partial [Candidatus Omnitrophica bacterium]|nr:tetratricopeptide repeat protein [Candidatus Omnitrophota bacterium]